MILCGSFKTFLDLYWLLCKWNAHEVCLFDDFLEFCLNYNLRTILLSVEKNVFLHIYSVYFLFAYTQKPEQENEKLGVTHSTSRTVEPRGPALTIAASITAQCHAKIWQIFGETCPIPPGCVQFYTYKTFCRWEIKIFCPAVAGCTT